MSSLNTYTLTVKPRYLNSVAFLSAQIINTPVNTHPLETLLTATSKKLKTFGCSFNVHFACEHDAEKINEFISLNCLKKNIL